MFEYFNGILLENVQFIGQAREDAYTLFCVEIVALVRTVRYKLRFNVLGEIVMDERTGKLPMRHDLMIMSKRKNSRRLVRVKWLCQTIRV